MDKQASDGPGRYFGSSRIDGPTETPRSTSPRASKCVVDTKARRTPRTAHADMDVRQPHDPPPVERTITNCQMTVRINRIPVVTGAIGGVCG